MELLEQSQGRAMKMIRGLEHLPDGDRLRQPWAVQPGEEKAPRRHYSGPSALDWELRKSWGGTFNKGMLQRGEGKWL